MPSYFPEGDTPLPSDDEMRSLQKLVSLGITAISGATGMYGPTTGLFVGGVPTVVPAGEVAIAIDSDGNQFQYFNGAWH